MFASPESQVPGYRPDVDGLRAIAILVVVAFHAFPRALPGGFVGVDVFFVISGYLISTIVLKALAKGTFRFRDFYARRARRLFPALVAVLLFAAAAGWVALLPTEYAQLGRHVAAGAAFVENAALFQEAGYFDVASEAKPLLHLWSLAVEEQFYLGYPLLLWLALRARLGTATVIAAVASASFALSLRRLPQHPEEVFFLTHTRLWELMVGCFLAQVTVDAPHELSLLLPPQSRRAHAVSVAGLALVLGSAWGLSRETPFPGAAALLPTVGAALLLAAGPAAWVNRRLLSARPMVFVGLVSYPLYLWHWPLLSFAAIGTREPPTATRLALVAAAFGLAWATRRFVEGPFRFAPEGRRLRLPALVAALAACGAVGLCICASGGVPSRFPQDIRELAGFAPDFKTDARHPACWVPGVTPATGWAPECLGEPAGGPGAVFLWGDSHAARLYPGLAQALAGKARPSQYTRDACSPAMRFGHARCMEGNAAVLRLIEQHRPETVVLFANWRDKSERWQRTGDAGRALAETIQRVRLAGVKRVVLLGNAPSWVQALPRLVHDAWKADYPLHRVPARLAGHQKPGLDPVDADLREVAAREGATFFSVRDVFCDGVGCLTRVEADAFSLTTYDEAHLSTPASRHLAERLLPLLAAPVP